MKYLPFLILMIFASACSNSTFTHYRVKATCASSTLLLDSLKYVFEEQDMRVETDSRRGTLFAYSKKFWRGGMNVEFVWKIFIAGEKEIIYECREKRSWKTTKSERSKDFMNPAERTWSYNNLQYVYLIDEIVDEETEEYWKARNYLNDRCTGFEVFEIDSDPELDIKFLPL